MGVEVELQRAVYTLLNGSIGASVYDVAPQAADGGDASAFPYVPIGSVFLTDDPVDEADSFAPLMRVHTFSRTGSMLECKTIQGAIYSTLHNVNLTVTGFNCYSVLRESTECVPEDDGQIHGICEYRFLIETE